MSLALQTMIPYAIVALALLLPGIAVAVRRLHDVGRSGWWYLIGFIPIIGTIILLVWFVTASDGPNDYGNGPDTGAAGVGAGSLA